MSKWNHLNPFEPGTTVRAESANFKFDGIAASFTEIYNWYNTTLLRLPQGYSGSNQIPNKSLANTVLHFTPEGALDVYPLDRILEANDAASLALLNAEKAVEAVSKIEAIGMSEGLPVTVKPGHDFDINQNHGMVDVIFYGSGSLNFPPLLIGGRRYYVKVSMLALDSDVVVIDNRFKIIGRKQDVLPGKSVILRRGDHAVFDVLDEKTLELR